ncbi:MAG: DMT family transporter [Candidatus Paceibacterota bacterium]|jgi:drug/metabolite transporter (DMT)-like permease
MKLSKGFYLTFGAAFFWALGIITTKFIFLRGENVFNFTFWVIIFATPFWIFILSRNFGELKKITKQDYILLLSIGLISMVLLNIVDFFAIKYSQAINYSFLIRTSIIFTIFFSFIFLGEKITLKKIILATMILIGAFFLTTKGQKIILTTGDILTLIDAALVSFGNTILGKIAVKRMSSGLSASVSFLVGVLPITIIVLYLHKLEIPHSIYLIILAAIFSTVGTLFRFKAYQNATASYVAMVYSFTPVIVFILAVTFLKESVTYLQLLGGTLIVLSGVLVEKLKM